MAPALNWVGKVYRRNDEGARHFKFYVVVADNGEELATVYINTAARYAALPSQLQSNQLPITPNELSRLDYDSFIDCSTINECNKSDVNSYLQKNKGHDCGRLNEKKLAQVMAILNRSKVIEKNIKEKYGFRIQ